MSQILQASWCKRANIGRHVAWCIAAVWILQVKLVAFVGTEYFTFVDW